MNLDGCSLYAPLSVATKWNPMVWHHHADTQTLSLRSLNRFISQTKSRVKWISRFYANNVDFSWESWKIMTDMREKKIWWCIRSDWRTATALPNTIFQNFFRFKIDRTTTNLATISTHDRWKFCIEAVKKYNCPLGSRWNKSSPNKFSFSIQFLFIAQTLLILRFK